MSQTHGCRTSQRPLCVTSQIICFLPFCLTSQRPHISIMMVDYSETSYFKQSLTSQKLDCDNYVIVITM